MAIDYIKASTTLVKGGYYPFWSMLVCFSSKLTNLLQAKSDYLNCSVWFCPRYMREYLHELLNQHIAGAWQCNLQKEGSEKQLQLITFFTCTITSGRYSSTALLPVNNHWKQNKDEMKFLRNLYRRSIYLAFWQIICHVIICKPYSTLQSHPHDK